MKLLFLPFLFLFLNANETEFTNTNILFSKKTNSSCSLGFDQLLNESLNSHPSISMSKDIVANAEQEVQTAFWSYFPSPSIDISAVDSNNIQTVVKLDQPIWTGGKLDAAYGKAKAKKNEADVSFDEHRYELIESFLKALKDYFEAKEKIQVLKENKEQLVSLLEMLERMITAGIASEIDKSLLKSRLDGINSDLVITNAKKRVAKMQLEILSGKTIGCDIRYEYDSTISSDIDIEILIEKMLTFHPALKKIDTQVKTAIFDVESSKSKMWPSLILRNEYRTGSIYAEVGEPIDKNLLYLTFQMSTGAGLSAVSNISAAKINVSKVKYQKLAKERELIDELMADYTNYISANDNIDILANNIVTLRKIYESNKRLFLAQKKQWLDLVNSLSELHKKKTEYSKLLIDKKYLGHKIFLKVGKIDLETGSIINDL